MTDGRALERITKFLHLFANWYDHICLMRRSVRKRVSAEIMRREANSQDPRIVAETVIKIIETEKPKLHTMQWEGIR